MRRKTRSLFNYKLFDQMVKRSGLKSNFLAKQIGVSDFTLSSWRTGRFDPTTNNLLKIARYFKVDHSSLIAKGGTDG